jgi:hypothetical protein
MPKLVVTMGATVRARSHQEVSVEVRGSVETLSSNDSKSCCQELPATEAVIKKSMNARIAGDSSRLLGNTALTSTVGSDHSGNSRTRRPDKKSGAHR